MILTTHNIIDASYHDIIPVNGIIKWHNHLCLFKLDPIIDWKENPYNYDVYHSGFGRRVKSERYRKGYEWDLAPICGRFSINPSSIVYPNGWRPPNFKIEQDTPKEAVQYGNCYLLWDGKFFGPDFATIREAARFAYRRITTDKTFDPKTDFGCFYCFQTVGLECKENQKSLEAGYEFRNHSLVQNITVQFYHYLNQIILTKPEIEKGY